MPSGTRVKIKIPGTVPEIPGQLEPMMMHSNLSRSTLSVESERCGKLRWSRKTGKRGIWERRRAYCGASVLYTHSALAHAHNNV